MPANFKVLSGASGEPNDPDFENVTLLLHGDGSNGAQNNTFLDSSSNNFTVTRNGNATQGSFSPYGSVWSNYFDGSGDYLTAPSNAAFAFGTGDFTIEAWIYCTALSGVENFIFDSRSSVSTSGMGFNIEPTTGKLRYSGNANNVLTSTGISVNQWTHVAWVRSGTTLTGYINGVAGGSVSNSDNLTQTVGAVGVVGFSASGYFNGYMSNVRVVKGTAVYTANFTPSTTPLTAITNTSLLTCQSNRFLDASTNNFAITRNGDVKVSSFGPFAPSAAYSTAVNGGSAYFDGTGDYLTVTRNAAFVPTTGDFTLETWVYPTTSGTTRFIGGLLQQGVAGDWSIFLHTNDTLGFYAGGADSFGGTVTPYQWNHIAVSRSGSTIYKCVNGTATTATFTNSLDSSTGYNLTVGADRVGSIPFQGWMTDFRVVKGTAVYTATSYTVPTTPLSAITNTGLFTKFQNAAIFDNSTKNDLETVGNAQISTSVKKFGTGSIYFDGSGDYLSVPSNPNMEFGSGNLTIEGWFKTATSTAYCTVFSRETGGFGAGSYGLFVNGGSADGVLQFWCNEYSTGSPLLIASSGNTRDDNWHHFAIVRNGSSWALYLDGTSVGTRTSSITLGTATANIIIGANLGYSRDFTGYIDDLRITKGVARYTANFTPPAAAFPNK